MNLILLLYITILNVIYYVFIAYVLKIDIVNSLTKTEFDLATLTLRLFYAFNKANMLPSAYTIEN